MRSLLEREGFDITVRPTQREALKLISSERYDVLLSDLHMPGAADGLTVISAMRHLNPKAIAVLLTGFPEMDVAARRFCDSHEIMIKRTDLMEMVESIKRRIAGGTVDFQPKVESVATILERAAPSCIENWFLEAQIDSKLSIVPLTPEQRCGHLPRCSWICRSSPGGLPFAARRYHIIGGPWVDTTSAGLFRCDDGRRVTHLAGLYFPYTSK